MQFNIKLNIPASVEITKLRASGATLAWTSGNTATIKASPNWEESKVSLFINEDENNEGGLKLENILTVPEITTEDIEISIAAWDSVEFKDGYKQLPLTITLPANHGNVTSMSSTIGEIVQEDGQIPALKVVPAWEDVSSVTITLNGISKVVNYTIPKKWKRE